MKDLKRRLMKKSPSSNFIFLLPRSIGATATQSSLGYSELRLTYEKESYTGLCSEYTRSGGHGLLKEGELLAWMHLHCVVKFCCRLTCPLLVRHPSSNQDFVGNLPRFPCSSTPSLLCTGHDRIAPSLNTPFQISIQILNLFYYS